jgi:hypothetical protein
MKRKEPQSTIYRDNFNKSTWFKDWLKNPKLFHDYAGIRKWAALINKTEVGNWLIDKFSPHLAKFARVPNNIFWVWNRFRNPDKYYQFADDHKWIFIFGCNNSGTTLIHDLLAFHEDIASLPLEGQALTEVFPRSSDFDVARVWSEKMDHFQMTEADKKVNSAHLIHDWKNYLNNVNASTILEKTPSNILRCRWLQKVFKNSYFIGISRDGRAVAEGISRRTPNIDYSRAITHWSVVSELILDTAKYLKNFKHLRYEELVENPRQTIDELLTFINLSSTILMKNQPR